MGLLWAVLAGAAVFALGLAAGWRIFYPWGTEAGRFTERERQARNRLERDRRERERIDRMRKATNWVTSAAPAPGARWAGPQRPYDDRSVPLGAAPGLPRFIPAPNPVTPPPDDDTVASIPAVRPDDAPAEDTAAAPGLRPVPDLVS
jgi:hypothetical protein